MALHPGRAPRSPRPTNHSAAPAVVMRPRFRNGDGGRPMRARGGSLSGVDRKGGEGWAPNERARPAPRGPMSGRRAGLARPMSGFGGDLKARRSGRLRVSRGLRPLRVSAGSGGEGSGGGAEGKGRGGVGGGVGGQYMAPPLAGGRVCPRGGSTPLCFLPRARPARLCPSLSSLGGRSGQAHVVCTQGWQQPEAEVALCCQSLGVGFAPSCPLLFQACILDV